MRQIPDYPDISTDDFRAIDHRVHAQVGERLFQRVRAKHFLHACHIQDS